MNKLSRILHEVPYTKFSNILTPSIKLSKIERSDKQLLEKTIKRFRPNSEYYEDSWGYLLQATRYSGYKLYDEETGSLIFFCRKSRENSQLVIPTFFANLRFLVYSTTYIQKVFNTTHTILKNVDSDESSKFKKYGFREYTQHEKWNLYAKFDDQTYPQQLVDLKRLTHIKDRSYHKLRNLLSKQSMVTIREYKDTDKEAVLKLLKLKDHYNNKPLSHAAKKNMYYESHKMYPGAEIDNYVVLDCITKDIVGFIALSDITSLTTASVASIFKNTFKKVSAACEYQLLMKKYHEDFRYVNLGGSEYLGDNNFKIWTFRPIKEIEKIHLVYDPK